MTLAICTHATEGMQDAATAALQEAFLDPAVDTPLTEDSGGDSGAPYFL
jgi:hypothetical protein